MKVKLLIHNVNKSRSDRDCDLKLFAWGWLVEELRFTPVK